MQQHDKIKQYIYSICEQIRWKKVHNSISNEIENHITDQKNAFMAEGFDESESLDKAIAQMGDPITVGSQLDHTHRPKKEWSIIILTISALLVGLAINFFVKSSQPYTDDLFYFRRTVVVTVAGIICMITAYFIDFSIIGKYPKIIFISFITFVFILSLFAFPINGAKRWIQIPLLGSVSISSFILLFPTAYAGIIYCFRNKGYSGIILCGVYFVIPMFIFLLANQSISSVLVYIVVCFTLLSFSIYKGYFNVRRLYGFIIVYVPTFITVIITFFNVFLKSYRVARFEAFLNPYSDPHGAGYVMILVRNMISGAKFFGQGDLPSHYSGNISGWLPSMNTGYIAVYLIHKVGWISFIFIFALLTVFVVRGFYLCAKHKSVLGKLVSTSIMLALTFQMIIYISANLGYQLFAPLSLPFISYGGSDAIFNLILIGVLLSVLKSGELLDDKQSIQDSYKLFEFEDGKIIINLRACLFPFHRFHRN